MANLILLAALSSAIPASAGKGPRDATGSTVPPPIDHTARPRLTLPPSFHPLDPAALSGGSQISTDIQLLLWEQAKLLGESATAGECQASVVFLVSSLALQTRTPQGCVPSADQVSILRHALISYRSVVGGIANDGTLPQDERRDALRAFTSHVIALADALGSCRLSSGTLAQSITEAVLASAALLAQLNTAAEVIALPATARIGGGFIQAAEIAPEPVGPVGTAGNAGGIGAGGGPSTSRAEYSGANVPAFAIDLGAIVGGRRRKRRGEGGVEAPKEPVRHARHAFQERQDQVEHASLNSNEEVNRGQGGVNGSKRHKQSRGYSGREGRSLGAGLCAVAVVEFADDSLFPSAATARIPGTHARIGSAVLSASLGVDVHDLGDADRICGTYKFTVNLDRDSTWTGAVGGYDPSASPSYSVPQCVYYDHAAMEWSQEGCELMGATATHATCCCNHLTSFAVLVVGEEPEVDDPLALTIVTWIGVGLSLTLLTLTAITVVGAPELRHTLHYQIFLNLVVALLLSQFLFLMIKVPTKEEPCVAVSFLLMYAVLSSLAWMNIEGHDLYSTFVTAHVWMSGQTDEERLRKSMAFGWGVPLLVTAAAMICDYDHMISTVETRGSDGAVLTSEIGHCWPARHSMALWFFLGPMIFAAVSGMFHTVAILTTVGRLLRRRRRRGLAQHSSEEVVGSVKVIVMVITVTGVAWVFGVFMLLQDGNETAIYLFTIINTLQGAMIFVGHVSLLPQFC